MKVDKKKFDAALEKLLKAAPAPRKKIKTAGRSSSKAPLIKPS
jgi:hypothetical protein